MLDGDRSLSTRLLSVSTFPSRRRRAFKDASRYFAVAETKNVTFTESSAMRFDVSRRLFEPFTASRFPGKLYTTDRWDWVARVTCRRCEVGASRSSDAGNGGPRRRRMRQA